MIFISKTDCTYLPRNTYEREATVAVVDVDIALMETEKRHPLAEQVKRMTSSLLLFALPAFPLRGILSERDALIS